MASYSDKLSEVSWGDFQSLIRGIGGGGNNQNTGGRQPSGNNSPSNNSNNNPVETTYLKDLEKVQDYLNKQLTELSDDINQRRSEIRQQFQDYQSEEKAIENKKQALEKALLKNKQANNALQDSEYKNFLETRNKQIKAELQLLNEEEKYQKTKAALQDKEIENETLRTKIREQNFAHTLELENKKLKFEEEHLEKLQAVADKQLELQQVKQEYELKGYNKDGKKNSGAEIFNMLGDVKSFFKGNSVGRIVGEGLSKATNGIAKGAAFVNAGKMDVGAIADKMSGALSKAGPYGAAAGGIIQILKTVFDMYSKVNTAAVKFARSAGGGAEAVRSMQTHMAAVAKNLSSVDDKFISWGKRAYDAAKLMEAMAEYSEKMGRNTQYFNEKDIRALQDLKDFGIGTDVINQLDTFGLSANAVSKKMAEIYSSSGKHGLNAKAVTNAVNQNLKMAEKYTFAGGVKALERMAEKSVALKYNMNAVAQFADKVSTLEGAATAGAHLSVLGSSFARMGNPLSMLYGGLQDPERLNDMMLEMTKSMAQWDRDKGQMDITAYNRQRLKAAADAMGVDYGDLVSQAMNQGKRNIIDNSIGGGVKEDTREFIRNIATLNDEGKAVVNIKTGRKNSKGEDEYKEKLVSQLTEDDKKALQAESEKKGLKEGATIGDLLEQTMSTQEKLDAILEQIKTKLVNGIFRIYNILAGSWVLGQDGSDKIDMNTISMSQEEQDKFALLQKAQNNYGDLSKEDKKTLKGYGITSQSQLAGLSKGELAEVINRGNIQQKKDGGSVYSGEVKGVGGPREDKNVILASRGEYVVNAKDAQANINELRSINNGARYADGGLIGSNSGFANFDDNIHNTLMTTMSVYNRQRLKAAADSMGVSGFGQQRISINPMDIKVSGTIDIAGGGTSKSLDIKELLGNNTFITQLARQLEVAFNYSLDKHNVHLKYPMPFA